MRHRCTLAGIAFFIALPVNAGEWEIVPTVSLEQVFTDNVNQAPDDEEADAISRVMPGISIQGRGRRLALDFNYQVTAQKSANDDARSQTTQQLATDGTAELWEQIFFVDFSANASQQAVNNNNQNLNQNFVDNVNIDDVYTYEASPFFLHHLGFYADTEYRLTYNTVINASDDAEDSTSLTEQFTITSGDRFQITPWSITYRDETIREDGADDQIFSSIEARVSYVLSRRYTAFVGLGYVDNEFDSNDDDVDQKGRTWDLGFTWTPTGRTELEASYGNELFGSTFALDFSHRSRRTLWAVRYNEQITNTRTQQLAIIPLESLNPDPNVPVDVFSPLATLVNEVFVNRSFTLSSDLSGRRTDARVELFYDSRTFQETQDEEFVFGARFRFDRQLTPLTTLNMSANWSQTEFRDVQNDGEEQVYDIGLGLTKQLGAKSSVVLFYRRQVRTSDDANDEFTENNLSLSWSLKL